MKKIITLLLSLTFATYAQLSSASQIQTPESIQAAVKNFIATSLSSNTEYKIKLGNIDQRLRLPNCTESLVIFSQNDSLKPGRNSIGVKCNSIKKWTIYTTAVIHIYKDVAVLSQPIKRGEIFSDNMLHIEKRDISKLRSGFISNIQKIINKQATRNLMPGITITKSNYTEPKLIKRGEKINIKTSIPNLDISVSGIALMDGIKGQNIRVKNINSKQIVQATVVQQGLVVVIF